MNKKSVTIIIVVLAIGLIVLGLYGTFAAGETATSDNNTYSITLTGETNEVIVPAGGSKTVIYQVTNTNKGTVQYGVAYSGNNITAKVYDISEDDATGTIEYGETKFVKLILSNSGTTDSTASVKAVLGYENGGSLDSVVPSGHELVSSKINTINENAVIYITDLYDKAEKTIVKNGSEGEKVEYNYATSVGLMNDRLGGTTSNYNAGNIRYYGTNPNNYVDIGDRDSSGNIILYRIIGVFKDMVLSDGTKKDLVKVVRKDSIGEYSWDNKTSGIGSSLSDYGSNDWSDSRLMMLLNPGYDKYNESNTLKDTSGNIVYGYEGSLWWNSKSGICYAGRNITKSCDFTSAGLSSEVHNKIETVVWNLGDNNTSGVYSDTAYTNERGTTVYGGRPSWWKGKVALIYPSDYGYATDLSNCNESIDEYYKTIACYDENWLKKNSTFRLLLAPVMNSIHSVFSTVPINIAIGQGSSFGGGTAYSSTEIVPVFYINSELIITHGTGTSKDPYVIK